MASAFDPYESWLGVSKQPLHPDRYRLLGLPAFTTDAEAIRSAADAQKNKLQPHVAGPQAPAAQRMLEELSLAEACLLDAGKRSAYDGLLRQQMAARGETPPDNGSATNGRAAPTAEGGGIDDWLPPVAGPVSGSAGVSPPQPIPMAAIPVAVAAPLATAPVAVAVYGSAISRAVPVYGSEAYAPSPAITVAMPVPASSDVEEPAWSATPSPGTLPAATSFARGARGKRSLTPLLLAIVAPLALVGVFGLAAYLVNESGKPPPPLDDSAGTRIASNANGIPPRERPRPSVENPRRSQATNSTRPPMTLAEAASRPEETPDDEMPDAVAATEMPEEMPDEPSAEMPEGETPAEAMPDEAVPAEAEEPEPEPEAEPMLSVADALMAARRAMGEQKLATAKRHIDAATASAVTDEERLEIERVSALYVYVEAFWNAVSESLKGLGSGMDFAYDDTRIGVVENGDNRLVLRRAGANEEHAIDNLPTKLAVAIAENWFDKNDPRYLLSIGAYLVVHPKGDRERAEALWLQAQLDGLGDEAQLIMPELTVKVPAAEEEPAAVAATETPGDGRLAAPTEVERSGALEQVRTLYADDYGQAVDAPAKLLLADKLLEAAVETSRDPTLRFVLLVEARDLGAAAGDVGTISRAADALAEHYRVDPWEQRAAAITAGAKQASPETCELLAQAGLDMSDEAVLTEDFGAARALVRAAQAAARKSSNRDLVKETATRLKEIPKGSGG